MENAMPKKCKLCDKPAGIDDYCDECGAEMFEQWKEWRVLQDWKAEGWEQHTGYTNEF